ncbi:J domain-containing protein [Chloroflexota bacterium]
MRWKSILGHVFNNIWRFICFWIIKVSRTGTGTVSSVRLWIKANSSAKISHNQANNRMEDTPPIPLWILPETRKKAVQRAKDRANQSKWDLDTAIFLFGILAIVFILIYQGIGIWITAPVATVSLILVWFVGFKKARQSYKLYFPEELKRYPETWKDYYQILHINPGTKPDEIVRAYDKLSLTFRDNGLSEKNAAQSKLLNDAEEAYKVLSDLKLKATYDYIYWSSFNTNTEADTEFKEELIELSQNIYKEVIKTPRYSFRAIPFLDRIPSRAIKVMVSIILIIFLLGTTLAFSKPENVLAAPFRGVAASLAKASTGIVELLNVSREVASSAEHTTISTALQLMRIEEGLRVVPSVAKPENDMAFFPSKEFSLYPEYLDRRYSQFRYTVNSKGIMAVDTSWATTDGFLEFMQQIINRIEKTG